MKKPKLKPTAPFVPYLRRFQSFPSDALREHMKLRGNTENYYPPGREHLEPLKWKLLSIAGWAVALPEIEEDLKNILLRGVLLTGTGAFFQKMRPSQCHENVAVLKDNNPHLVIYTGYAIDKDGIWVQHSWAYDPDKNHVIETTMRRKGYFGFALTEKEANIFIYENYD